MSKVIGKTIAMEKFDVKNTKIPWLHQLMDSCKIEITDFNHTTKKETFVIYRTGQYYINVGKCI